MGPLCNGYILVIGVFLLWGHFCLGVNLWFQVLGTFLSGGDFFWREIVAILFWRMLFWGAFSFFGGPYARCRYTEFSRLDHNSKWRSAMVALSTAEGIR